MGVTFDDDDDDADGILPLFTGVLLTTAVPLSLPVDGGLRDDELGEEEDEEDDEVEQEEEVEEAEEEVDDVEGAGTGTTAAALGALEALEALLEVDLEDDDTVLGPKSILCMAASAS